MITKPCDEVVLWAKCEHANVENPYNLWAGTTSLDPIDTRRAIFVGSLIVPEWCSFRLSPPNRESLIVTMCAANETKLSSSTEPCGSITAVGYDYQQEDLGPIDEDYDIEKREFYKLAKPIPGTSKIGVKAIEVWRSLVA